MNEKFPYQKQWQEYRRRRNRQYIVGVAGMLLPGLLVFALLKSGLALNKVIWLYIFIAGFAMIVIFAVIYHFHGWSCPNCGKRFFVRSFWHRFPEFLRSCTNCNLPKYTGSTFERN